MQIHHLRKTSPIAGVKVSLADIKLIYERTMLQVGEQADLEIAGVTKKPDQTEEQFEAFKKDARERAFRVTTTITGVDGQELYGEDETVFNAANRPDRIAKIFMTNVTAYRGFAGAPPNCEFSITFDFSKPPLMDWANPVSAPTVNNSTVSIGGWREGWVAAINDAIFGILSNRKTNRSWLHQGFRYDLGLYLIAIPLAFYFCWKLSSFVTAHLASIDHFLSAAFYLYAFIAIVNIYRGFFGYAKWAFPTVELSDNNDNAVVHRGVLGAVLVALIANVIWEVLTHFSS